MQGLSPRRIVWLMVPSGNVTELAIQEIWPELAAVDASTAVSGDWTLVDRKDSDKKIVAYKGMPLYLWIKDTKPGDTTGDGVGGTWHTAIAAD